MSQPKLPKVNRVHLLMATVFVVGLALAGDEFLDAQELGTVLRRVEVSFLPLLLLLPLIYLWLKSVRYVDLFSFSGPPLTSAFQRHQVMHSYGSAQSATLLPGGYVARIGLVQATTKLGARAVIPTLLEKGIDLLVLALIGLGTSSIFPQTQKYVAPLGILLALTFTASASPRVRGWFGTASSWILGKLCRKKLVQEALSFHRPTGPVLAALSVQTAAVLCLEFLLLWVSFAALGLQVNPLLLVIAYCASDIIGRLAPTPGGVGFTELGMVTLISSFSLLGLEQAAAAVFLFRAALFLLPAFYGACCYTRLRFDESQTSDALKR